MQKGSSAIFYHSHITSNIQKVQQRTQGYIKHRKQFLRKYCQPLEQKIQKLDKQIDFYNHLIQNQNEMIENEDEVKKLKDQVGEFLCTQKYFLQHLEEYEQKVVTLTMENKLMEGRIRRIKSELAGMTKLKTNQVYAQLNHDRDKHSTMGMLNRSKVSERLSQSKSSRQNNQQTKHNILLPTIFKVEKYYVSKETSKIKQKMSQRSNINNRKNKSFTFDVSLVNSDLQKSLISLQNNERSKIQTFNKIDQTQQISLIADETHQQKQFSMMEPKTKQDSSTIKRMNDLKNRFKKLMTNFNKFQILFKECFQRKKLYVQKSVRQLQSKLISDRQRFLQICEGISEKNIKKIPFQLFVTMSSDQIMTLMISYPWIQKRLFKQIGERRKKIIQLQTHSKFL